MTDGPHPCTHRIRLGWCLVSKEPGWVVNDVDFNQGSNRVDFWRVDQVTREAEIMICVTLTSAQRVLERLREETGALWFLFNGSKWEEIPGDQKRTLLIAKATFDVTLELQPEAG